jgi:hypothetical protein
VRGNSFSGPGDRAVQLTGDSTGCVVTGNTVTSRMRPFEIDQQPERGFQESDNNSRNPGDFWAEPPAGGYRGQGERPGEHGDHHSR